ncbi:MAG: amidohydrolase family protein [Myxococcales bacterium]|nr:amidohydrolase family protein [Myxococcales bacterium]
MSNKKRALRGRVVTMNASDEVLRDGVVYIDGDEIVAVQPADAAPPSGFARVAVVNTKGTLYPGLIELHNHLSYDLLRLWQVPKKFGNRGQWPGHEDYHQLVTGPMAALAGSKDARILPSLVRWVEAKCLVAGVTTSQGIRLASGPKIVRYYRGIVRNVESKSDSGLLPAASRIADVSARDFTKFKATLDKAEKRGACLLLHLAEGVDEAARKHFLALKSGKKWALGKGLAGIHCAGLAAKDFAEMGKRGASMVWSPLSNYLLYGDTANVAAALEAGVRIGIGSDWSPTGSKNLFGELKVARLVAAEKKLGLSDQDVLAMATRTAADILGWGARLGSLEAGKLADLVVVGGKGGAPFAHFFAAKETDIALVVIGGTPRFGVAALMKTLGVRGERFKVGGKARMADWDDPDGDPDVERYTLAEAKAVLTAALRKLPKLAADEAKGLGAGLSLRRAAPKVRLVLDEQEEHGFDLRPRLGLHGKPTGFARPALAAAPKKPLIALRLDPLTVADDPDFISAIKREKNLPPFLKRGIARALG